MLRGMDLGRAPTTHKQEFPMGDQKTDTRIRHRSDDPNTRQRRRPASLSGTAPTPNVWVPVRDADSRAIGLYRRHYTYPSSRLKKAFRLRFAGPGEYLMLLTRGSDAIFVWRLFRENKRAKPRGVNCSIFRNESAHLSSEMILHAEAWALTSWPTTEWLYTYVNPLKVSSPNPGYCFKMAGWQLGPPSKSGLISLWKRASESPAPAAFDLTYLNPVPSMEIAK